MYKTFTQVLSVNHARGILQSSRVVFDQMRVMTLSHPAFNNANVRFHEIVYFFNKGVEIAYYCAPTSTLTIHETPRIWAREFMERTVVY